jgi:hypothetical protein
MLNWGLIACQEIFALKSPILAGEGIQEEWDKITIEEIHARIDEMPDRCQKLVDNGGEPIKSKLW